MNGTVLLLGAGRGQRFGGRVPKALIELDGVPLIRRSADAAAAAAAVDRIVAAVPEGLLEVARDALAGLAVPFAVVAGGAIRQQSAALALEAAGDARALAVHDAARALCPSSLFDRCLDALDDHEAVVAAVPVVDTLKQVDGDVVVGTPDRSALVAAQTPQAFRAEVYRRAHEAARRDGFEGTDDASLVERIGVRVAVVEGHTSNIKITCPDDLVAAATLLRST